MTDGESRFVEEMGQMLASYGMTPMAGRMWGWLMICEPAEQTAAEIAEALARESRCDQRHGAFARQRRTDPALDSSRRSPRVLQRPA